MAAAVAAREAKFSPGDVISYLMKVSVSIYKGTLVMINTSGYVLAGADTASQLFAGVAYETKTSDATTGSTSISVYKTGEFDFNASSATQAWVGVAVYIVDDNTVALAATTTNDILVGYVTKLVSASVVRVRIDRAVQ